MLISLQGEYRKILALGTGLENLGSRDRIGQYYSASRDGHQIHPHRVTWIDSVKINPSLVMMRECKIQLVQFTNRELKEKDTSNNTVTKCEYDIYKCKYNLAPFQSNVCLGPPRL